MTTALALAVAGAGLAAAATGAPTTTVNIRSGPSTSHAIKGSLVRGQRIEVTSKSSHGWVTVSFAGSTAYMSAKYVDTKGSLPAAPKKISTSGTKVLTETLNVQTRRLETRAWWGHSGGPSDHPDRQAAGWFRPDPVRGSPPLGVGDLSGQRQQRLVAQRGPGTGQLERPEDLRRQGQGRPGIRQEAARQAVRLGR